MVRPETQFCENGFIMSSCLDVNMSCRLHLHVLMMKCAYVHVDIIDHALHKGFESTGRDRFSSKGCTHTPRPGKEAVKIWEWHKVRSAQIEMKRERKGHFAFCIYA